MCSDWYRSNGISMNDHKSNRMISGIRMTLDADDLTKMLDRMISEKALKKKDVRKVVRQEISKVRKDVMNSAKSSMGSDPRRAYMGVKTVVYKKINGGNVSLFNPKKAGGMRLYEQPKGGRSGIRRRRKISDRTIQINSYRGKDRAFILRFINEGTEKRTAYTKNRSKNNKTANRGEIRGKGFFSVATGSMQEASKRISLRVADLIAEVAEGK